MSEGESGYQPSTLKESGELPQAVNLVDRLKKAAEEVTGSSREKGDLISLADAYQNLRKQSLELKGILRE